MWVFGDGEIQLEAREAVERLALGWRRARGLEPGIARHGALVSLSIELGVLAQATADFGAGAAASSGRLAPRASGAPAGDEAPNGGALAEAPLLRAGLALARAIERSRRSRGRAGDPGEPRELLALLASGVPLQSFRGRIPEGYAFYALYPELYSEAARRFARAHGGRAFVVGLRSIGTSLACSVGAALDDVAGLFTLRPGGAPFEREAELPAALARAAARHRFPLLVVDEGPGLSGSTLASVAGALEAAGVARRRIHFLPGHDGALGPRAGPAQRACWERTPKHVVRFEEAILDERAGWPLSSWFEPILGPKEGALEDLSGGAWRARLFGDEAAFPPANVLLERRKYLFRGKRRDCMLKFSGLGPWAADHEARARALAATGLVPRVVGRAHGFLATEWREGAPLSSSADRPVELVAGAFADYLAVLGRQPTRRGGAAPGELLRMAERNAGLALGAERALELRRFRAVVARIGAEARPVAVDARMHAWEWLVTPGGELLKTDAFDHHAGHDLVGCQDLAWDVAGGLVELARAEGERARLLEALGRRGLRPPGEVLAFYEVCYVAFQLGSATMAAEMLERPAPRDSARFEAAAAGYARRLERLLA